MVMYAGRHVERASVDDIFYAPSHPVHARPARVAAAPRPPFTRRRLYRIKGQPPSLIRVPSGCAFHPRCPVASEPGGDLLHASDRNSLPVAGLDDHESACHFAASLDERFAANDEAAS